MRRKMVAFYYFPTKKVLVLLFAHDSNDIFKRINYWNSDIQHLIWNRLFIV